MLKEAGLDRINHNLNSSRSFYHNICSTHTFDQRVRNIHMLQGLGFEICSGGIIGMGESKEDVVDMLLELREIQPEALPINFLLPIKGTPLGNADISQLTTEYCMKVLCLARLLVPKADIRCAAGREVYFKGEEKKTAQCCRLYFCFRLSYRRWPGNRGHSQNHYGCRIYL